jgi:hypothetical protein
MGNLEKGPRDGLYLPMLWGGGSGLGARPEGVPRVGEPQEKELYAGPAAALGHDDRPGGNGTVFPGGLRLGSPVIVRCYTNKQNNPAAKVQYQTGTT